MTPEQYEYEQALRLVAAGDAIDDDLAQRKSSLVMLLMHRARQEAADAMMALIDVDPTDVETIRSHQNTIRRQRDLAGWINDTWRRANEFAANMSAADGDYYSDLASNDRDNIEDGVED